MDALRAGSARLFGGHVQRRAHDATERREQRTFGQLQARGCLRQAEVDDFRHWLTVVRIDQDVRWLQLVFDVDPAVDASCAKRTSWRQFVQQVAQ